MSVEPRVSNQSLTGAGRLFSRPKIVAITGLLCLVALGWIYLGLMVAQMVPHLDMSDAGPGMGIFNRISQWVDLGDFNRAVIAIIPGAGLLHITSLGMGWFTTAGFLTLMWTAMATAMMVPTAAPMISSYLQICETAAAKSIRTVSPLVLIAGYISVWIAFSITAALAQTAMMYVSIISPAMVASHKGLAALLLIFAGIYQFTELKQACLNKCRSPLSFFFANWSDRTGDIFKLGLRQGVFCLGCCWALMLIMFVAGVMNVIWMVLLTVLMVAEKTVTQADPLRRIAGFGLIAWGALLGGAQLL